jgi:AcrR family transcriptional regulator
MALQAEEPATIRTPLSRERVLRAAIDLADSSGIESVTMRRLAQELGVEAMTLYYYVANKEEMLEGIVAIVMGEIELPSGEQDWKGALRRTAISAHDVLVRHPWASARMMTSGLTPERLAYMEGILGCLRSGGFTPWQTHLAYHALESHIVGFTLWLAGMALPDDLADLASSVLGMVDADAHPFFVEHINEHLRAEHGEGDVSSFEFGLDLILDGLERMRAAA